MTPDVTERRSKAPRAAALTRLLRELVDALDTLGREWLKALHRKFMQNDSARGKKSLIDRPHPPRKTTGRKQAIDAALPLACNETSRPSTSVAPPLGGHFEHFKETADFLCRIIELLRREYKSNEHDKVILPLHAVRRLACVFETTALGRFIAKQSSLLVRQPVLRLESVEVDQ